MNKSFAIRYSSSKKSLLDTKHLVSSRLFGTSFDENQKLILQNKTVMDEAIKYELDLSTGKIVQIVISSVTKRF